MLTSTLSVSDSVIVTSRDSSANLSTPYGSILHTVCPDQTAAPPGADVIGSRGRCNMNSDGRVMSGTT